MDALTMTPDEIQRIGLKALAQALGPVGMILFLQQLEPGSGDYTRDRYQWLDENEDLDTLIERIQQTQRQTQPQTT